MSLCYYYAPTYEEATAWARLNDERYWWFVVKPEEIVGTENPVLFMCGEYWNRKDFAEMIAVAARQNARVTQLGNSLVGGGL